KASTFTPSGQAEHYHGLGKAWQNRITLSPYQHSPARLVLHKASKARCCAVGACPASEAVTRSGPMPMCEGGHFIQRLRRLWQQLAEQLEIVPHARVDTAGHLCA